MPGCIVSATTASFRSVEKRRRRATPVMTSTFENVSDIGVCLGLYLGPPAKAGVRSKQGAVHQHPAILEHEIEFKRARLPGDKNKTAIAIGLKLRDGARSSAGHLSVVSDIENF